MIRVLENNPFINFTYWFMERKEELSLQISKRVFPKANKDEQEDFGFELDLLFELLFTTLANFDYKGFTKASIGELKLTFSHSSFIEALEILPSLIPTNRFREDTIPFVKDNIDFFKGLFSSD